MENDGFDFISNPFDEIKYDCFEKYDRLYDKFMIRIPRTSEYNALFRITDEELREYISFFEEIKWKTAYDEAYIIILKDYQVKRRAEKIIKIKDGITSKSNKTS